MRVCTLVLSAVVLVIGRMSTGAPSFKPVDNPASFENSTTIRVSLALDHLSINVCCSQLQQVESILRSFLSHVLLFSRKIIKRSIVMQGLHGPMCLPITSEMLTTKTLIHVGA